MSKKKRRKLMKLGSKFHHYYQWILHLSEAPSSLTLVLMLRSDSFIDVDNVDAHMGVMHSHLSITLSSEALSQSHGN
jgi:hypothetical protein